MAPITRTDFVFVCRSRYLTRFFFYIYSQHSPSVPLSLVQFYKIQETKQSKKEQKMKMKKIFHITKFIVAGQEIVF